MDGFKKGMRTGEYYELAIEAIKRIRKANFLIKGKKICRHVWTNIDRYAKVNKDLVIPKIIIINRKKL